MRLFYFYQILIVCIPYISLGQDLEISVLDSSFQKAPYQKVEIIQFQICITNHTATYIYGCEVIGKKSPYKFYLHPYEGEYLPLNNISKLALAEYTGPDQDLSSFRCFYNNNNSNHKPVEVIKSLNLVVKMKN